MKINKILTICFISGLLFLVLNCSRKQEYPANPLNYFSSVKKVPGEKLAIDSLIIGNARDMHTIDNKIAVLDAEQKQCLLFIIDPENEQIVARGGQKGKGPGEITRARFMHKEMEQNTLFLYNSQMYQYFAVNVDSLIANPQYKARELASFSRGIPRIYYALRLSNGHFITSAETDKGRFLYLNEKAKVEDYLYDYPADGHKDVSDGVKALAYQLRFVRQPGGKSFASLTTYGTLIDVFETNDKDIERKHQMHFSNPQYLVQDKENFTAAPIDSDSKFGFINSAASKKYLFTIYSNKTLKKLAHEQKEFKGKYVLIFNWEGKAIKALQLKNPAYAIAVTPDNEKLYAVEPRPEPTIIEYELSLP